MTAIAEHLQYFTSVALFGLIWTIQLVHYPAFKYIDKDGFVDFAKMHTIRITYFVAPLMLLELLSAIFLLYEYAFTLEYILVLGIILLIWFATFFISVPYHSRLARGKDDPTIQKLIRSNWIRTTLWSLKLIILIFFI